MAQSLLPTYFKTLTPEEVEENREKKKEVAVLKVIMPPKQKRGQGRPKKQPATVPQLTRVPTASLPEVPGPSGIQIPSTSLEAAAEPETGPPHKAIKTMYSDKQKSRIATYARFHGKRQAARHFNVPRNNVQRWVKEENRCSSPRGRERTRRAKVES